MEIMNGRVVKLALLGLLALGVGGCCGMTEDRKASGACGASKDEPSCTACCVPRAKGKPRGRMVGGRCECWYPSYLGGIPAL